MIQRSELIFRKAGESDIQTILDFFYEVFNERRSVEYWKWQFMHDEHGWGWIMLAELDNEVVAQSAIIRQHFSIMGREVVGGQLCDAMVSSALRGKNVFSELADHQFKSMAESGGEVVFGFPSRNSFPGSYPMTIRKLDFRRVTNLKYYRKRIGIGTFAGVLINKLYKISSLLSNAVKIVFYKYRWARNIMIETVTSVPDDLDIALKHIRDYEVVSIWKDVPYLRWRYEQHPDHHYLFHVLRLDGKAEGLVVSRKCDDIIAICEVLHRRKNVQQAALLITHVLQRSLNSNARIVEFYGHDNGFFDGTFQTAGFKILPFSKTILIAKSLKNNILKDLFAIPDNWSIAYGDTDHI